MSSEIAIALVVDEHVNRPSHVPKTLVSAIDAINSQGADPATWSDRNGHTLIEAYPTERSGTTMTATSDLAFKIGGSGILSEQRDPFTSP